MARRSKTPLQTKKHLARLERERLQRRYILISTIVIVILVVGLLGYGLINEYVIKPNQAVLKVGEDKVTVQDFVAVARFNGQQIINNYIQNLQLAQFYGFDSSYYESFRQQAQSALDKDVLGERTLNNLIEDLLIRQEAKRRGITVSEEEILAEIQSQFGYYPRGTPTPLPTYPVIPTSTLSATQLALLPPTPTVTATPETTPTEAIPATATNTVTPTLEITATPTASPTPDQSPTPTLTATPYTEELFQQNYAQVIQEFEANGVPEKTIRWIIESQLYRQKVRAAILAELGLQKIQEQVWARHILVADEETAKQVIERLNAGEDFAALAKELSTDTASAQQGGDLGWFGRGKMVAEFEAAAFSLDIGAISQPVQSTSGWHIIQVLGHEDRALSESEYLQLEDQKFQEWLDAQRQATEIEINDIWRDFVPQLELPTSL